MAETAESRMIPAFLRSAFARGIIGAGNLFGLSFCDLAKRIRKRERERSA